jgi:hypothetical protein
MRERPGPNEDACRFHLVALLPIHGARDSARTPVALVVECPSISSPPTGGKPSPRCRTLRGALEAQCTGAQVMTFWLASGKARRPLVEIGREVVVACHLMEMSTHCVDAVVICERRVLLETTNDLQPRLGTVDHR